MDNVTYRANLGFNRPACPGVWDVETQSQYWQSNDFFMSRHVMVREVHFGSWNGGKYIKVM